MADPAQVAASYIDAYRRRIRKAGRWLTEHGRVDDNTDREAEIARRYGLLDEAAVVVVERFDAHQRAKVVESVEDLPEGTSFGTALWALNKEWGGTRYHADALAALEEAAHPGVGTAAGTGTDRAGGPGPGRDRLRLLESPLPL